MEQLDLNLLIAKKGVLISKLENLKENLKTLMEVINNDELGKDWKSFSANHIDRNNRLRENCWKWKLQIEELKRNIYNLNECIKVQGAIENAQKKELKSEEIDSRLGLVISNGKLRERIRSVVMELSYKKNQPLENHISNPKLIRVLEELKAIVTSISQETWKNLLKKESVSGSFFLLFILLRFFWKCVDF